MRCLYEILELDRGADEAEIKTAYRKGALRWHPDKNQANLKEAEERFKELQNAYEVLSDKHERAWYDAHRSDILRQGTSHQAGASANFTPGQAPEGDINLYPYFSSTCFSGYSDGPSGFYGVYEKLFATLAKQERESSEASGTGSRDFEQPPDFGTSETEWAQISAFYAFWASFSTVKSFTWADQYNPASAPSRKVRRLMEVENQKARKGKRREFNETVRELAAFVRKRDKRVAAHQAMEAQKKIESDNQERERRERERRERTQRAREYEQAAWAEAEALAAEEISEEAEAIPDELFCVACDKSFRTRNALLNHEKSKKHLEKVEVLRALLEEEEGLNAASSSSADSAVEDAPVTHETDLASSSSRNSLTSSRPGSHESASEATEPDSSLDRSIRDPEPHTEPSSSEGDGVPSEEEDAMLDALLKLRTGAQKPSKAAQSARRGGAAHGGKHAPGQSHGEEASPTARESAAQEAELRKEDTDHGQEAPNLQGNGTEPGDEPGEGAGRRKPKPRRRANLKASKSEKAEGKSKEMTTSGERRSSRGDCMLDGAEAACAVCGATFPSRTKLFQHIKQKGHAALKQ